MLFRLLRRAERHPSRSPSYRSPQEHPAFRIAGCAHFQPWGEDIFESITLFESIAAARSKFLFVELGAGKGRWSAHAITVGRANGLDARAILVEAEPQHVAGIAGHMAAAGIGADRYSVVEAAVGSSAGVELFLVSGPTA
jgi:hypothetical protein